MESIRRVGTIKGKFTREELESILGKPTWDWVRGDGSTACGLAPGVTQTAGWGDGMSGCCRIWIHTDGICIGGGLPIREDLEYARSVLQKIKEAKSGNHTD